MSLTYVCNACGVPFQSQSLLDNHQRRFCVSSRVDREAASILQRMQVEGAGNQFAPAVNSNNNMMMMYNGYSAGGNMQPAAVRSSASAPPILLPHAPSSYAPRGGAPNHHTAIAYVNGAASQLPSVDLELFQLIKTQQQQISIMQSLMNAHAPIGATQSPRYGYPGQLPYTSPADADLQHIEHLRRQNAYGFGSAQPALMAPLASSTGESSLTEGRYGLELFAVEGLDGILTCPTEDVSIVIREFVVTIEQAKELTPRANARRILQPPPPTTFLDSRGEHSFPAGCIALKKSSRRQRSYKLKKVECSFSLLQHRELHLFVVEFYAPDGRLLAWTDVSLDALGEKARPLRTGPVEAAVAMKVPQLRTIPGALLGLDTFRTSWKQGMTSGKKSRRAVSPESEEESSDDEEAKTETAAPPRKNSSVEKSQPQKAAPQSEPQPKALKQPSPSVPTTKPVDDVTSRATTAPVSNPPAVEDDATVKVGRGPQRDSARLSLDGLLGVPFNVIATRICVYFASVKGSDGAEEYPLSADNFFLRAPDLVAYQTLDSTTIEPLFNSEWNAVIGKSTCAVVVVECSEPKKGRFSLGHAILPLNQETTAGSYSTRLLWGDPRPSHLRHTGPKSISDEKKHQQEVERYDASQLNQSFMSQELLGSLRDIDENVSDAYRFWPCAYIRWRADSSDKKKPYREPAGQCPMTDSEDVLQRGRLSLQSKTPLALGITTQDKMVELFKAPKPFPTDDSIAFVAPYDPKRGVFVCVENLRGMTAERCIYKVMAETFVEGGTMESHFTEHHDFESDIGVPEYQDEAFIYRNVPYNPFAVAVFRVFKMLEPSIDVPGGIMPVAWSASKLFLDDNVARHGRFSVPMFAGVPPPKLLEELKSERIDLVITKWSNNPPPGMQKLDHYKPGCLITFCQGAAGREQELLQQVEPFRMEHRVLLIPPRLKQMFPCQEDEGYHEEPLSVVIQPGKTPLAFEEAINKQIKKFFKNM